MNEVTVTKIIEAAIEIMVRRANIELTGTMVAKVVGPADIWAAVTADPTGNTAFRLAELTALGINTHQAMSA